jgi:uncharacterized protein
MDGDGSVSTTLTPDQWWAALTEDRLLLLTCNECGSAWLPWIPNCPDCGPGVRTSAVESSGRGTLYSWVGIHHSISMPSDVPFTVASVVVEEGAMVYGRYEAPENHVPVGDEPVRVQFVDIGGRRQLTFVPDGSDTK